MTSQFVEVRDPIRVQVNELLAVQRQHLPINVQFDVKRAALNLGVEEKIIVELLHRFGFEEVPDKRHHWMRQPLLDVQVIHGVNASK